jgi:hypothetical protein
VSRYASKLKLKILVFLPSSLSSLLVVEVLSFPPQMEPPIRKKRNFKSLQLPTASPIIHTPLPPIPNHPYANPNVNANAHPYANPNSKSKPLPSLVVPSSSSPSPRGHGHGHTNGNGHTNGHGHARHLHPYAHPSEDDTDFLLLTPESSTTRKRNLQATLVGTLKRMEEEDRAAAAKAAAEAEDLDGDGESTEGEREREREREREGGGGGDGNETEGEAKKQQLRKKTSKPALKTKKSSKGPLREEGDSTTTRPVLKKKKSSVNSGTSSSSSSSGKVKTKVCVYLFFFLLSRSLTYNMCYTAPFPPPTFPLLPRRYRRTRDRKRWKCDESETCREWGGVG